MAHAQECGGGPTQTGELGALLPFISFLHPKCSGQPWSNTTAEFGAYDSLASLTEASHVVQGRLAVPATAVWTLANPNAPVFKSRRATDLVRLTSDVRSL